MRVRSKLILIFFFLAFLSSPFPVFSQCNWPEQICIGNEKYQCNDLGEWEYFDSCPAGTKCIKQTPTSEFVVCEGVPSIQVKKGSAAKTTTTPVVLPLSLLTESIAVLVTLGMLTVIILLVFRVSSKKR